MQKRAIRLLTFSDFDPHTSPLFSQLKQLTSKTSGSYQTSNSLLHEPILCQKIPRDFRLIFFFY